MAANLLSAGYNRVRRTTVQYKRGERKRGLRKNTRQPFQILYDSESRGYWLNELAFILHHDIDNAIRLSCVDSLLSALDAVRDVVQV